MRRGAMARVAAVSALLTASIVPCFACTFLITFDDQPKHDAGPLTSPTNTNASSSGVDPFPTTTTSPTGTVQPFDAGPPIGSCDTSLDPRQVLGCEHFSVQGAQVCADNPDFTDPYTSTISRDLITCDAPNAVCIQHCASRCAHLPDGFPDQCDTCSSRSLSDGDYCGSELGWVPKDANLLVHCRSGAMSQSSPPEVCLGTCVAASGLAHCQ
jgi:hypothetical protein